MVSKLTCAKIIKSAITSLLLLAIAFATPTANSGSIDVSHDNIAVRFKAYRMGVVASKDDNALRFGAGFGFRGEQYECFTGLHDNLKPYCNCRYSFKTMRVMLDADIQSTDEAYKTQLGVVYLLDDKSGARLFYDSDNEQLGVGIKKWF